MARKMRNILKILKIRNIKDFKDFKNFIGISSLASLARAPVFSSNHGRKSFVVSKPTRFARALAISMSRVDESHDQPQQGRSLTRCARSFASGSLRSPSPSVILMSRDHL